MIGLQQVKEFVWKVIRILMDKLQKVVNVGMMKSLITTAQDWFIDYGDVTCLAPKLHNSVKSALRESTAEKNIIKRKKLPLS